MRGWKSKIVIVLAATLMVPGAAATPQDVVPEASEEEREGKHRVVSPGPGGRTLQIDAGPGSIFGKDELILKEYVDIRFGLTRLQADYVRFVPSTNMAHAEGNVIFDHGVSRITAESLDFNFETETGIFYKARGYAEPSYYFEAEILEKISENELVLNDATFTACTQPIPYWSFKVGHGTLRLNEYAYLHNIQFKIGRATVFYSPYLVWPIKTDRASGLLFPEFGVSQRNGTVISNAFYWAMRRNMDLTYYLDYWSKAGWGNGVQYRYVPSDLGRGRFTGYFIRDQVTKDENIPGVSVDRWIANYQHFQEFDSGWRLVTDANFVSDFDYYLDFERDIRRSTSPQALTDIYLTKNWGFYMINMRGERREQLVNTLVPANIGEPLFSTREETIIRWIQPQVEFRGSRQRLGTSPLFLTLVSSAASFDKGDQDNAAYQRLDFNPTLSSQLSPVTWLNVDASVGVRDTYYTKSQQGDLGCDNIPGTGDFGEGNGVADQEIDANGDGIFDATEDLGCDNVVGPPGDFLENNGVRDVERTLVTGTGVVVDESLNRLGYTGALQIIGPTLSRVFDAPDSDFSPQYKHSIEPVVNYVYRSDVEDVERVIRFDPIDSIPARANEVSYGFVTRLFAKRPSSDLADFDSTGGYGSEYVGGSLDPMQVARDSFRREKERERSEFGEADEGEMEVGPDVRLSTVEVASFEINQVYSFIRPLSVSFALNEEKPVSPIRALLRINPSIRTSFDLRTSFDVLFMDFREVSLSANLRSRTRGFLDFTWTLTRDLEGKALADQGVSFFPTIDRSQIVLLGETSFFRQKLLLGLQLNYELGDISPGEPRLRDQRYKLGYNTQCCGFQVEYLERTYIGSDQQEIRFLINLRGVGNVVDMNSHLGGGGF